MLLLILFAVCGCAEETVHQLEDADYKVMFEKQVFDEKGCHVTLEYPVVQGLADEAKQADINSLLYSYVYNQFKLKCLVSESGAIEYNYNTVDAAVTIAKKGYFCALISVEYYSDDSSHGNYSTFTVHCGTDEVRLYSSADIIKSFEPIKSQFGKGKFSQEYGLTTLLASLTPDEIIARYSDDYELYPYVYFEDGKFGINVDVSHLYGGYAGFTIDIADVKKHLNTELEFVARLAAK